MTAPVAERNDIRIMELAAAHQIIGQLQDALAETRRELAKWEPLYTAHEREMTGRARRGFQVDPLPVWVRDLARQIGGVMVEDAGSVADSLQDRSDE